VTGVFVGPFARSAQLRRAIIAGTVGTTTNGTIFSSTASSQVLAFHPAAGSGGVQAWAIIAREIGNNARPRITDATLASADLAMLADTTAGLFCLRAGAF
jgi:hypothetical protein